MSEKPFGWRPFDEEQKQFYRENGFNDQQIAEMELGNVYMPDPYAIEALELSAALIEVLSKRLGPDFAREVQQQLKQRVEQLAAEQTAEGDVEAKILRDASEWPMWSRLAGA